MISRNVPKQNTMSGLFTFSVKVSTSLLAPCPSYTCIFHGQGEAVTSKGSRSWRLSSPDLWAVLTNLRQSRRQVQEDEPVRCKATCCSIWSNGAYCVKTLFFQMMRLLRLHQNSALDQPSQARSVPPEEQRCIQPSHIYVSGCLP